jgi:hypothetical protein
MGSACLASACDVDRGTAFSECASNPFADTAAGSCDNCYNSSFLSIFASLRQSHLFALRRALPEPIHVWLLIPSLRAITRYHIG